VINIGRDIDARSGANLNRGLIVHHLLALSGNDIDDLFRAGMIMTCVPLSLGQLDDPETETFRIRYLGFTEEMNLSPIKFKPVDVVCGGNKTRSKLLHKRGMGLFDEAKKSGKKFLGTK
jgi:hypothetical protein